MTADGTGRDVCEGCGQTVCRVPGCERSERALARLLAAAPPSGPRAEEDRFAVLRADVKRRKHGLREQQPN